MHEEEPRVYSLPWPRLNCLLAGFPGFNIDAAARGGVAPGEVLAIGGAPGDYKTTVCLFIANHFVQQHGMSGSGQPEVWYLGGDDVLLRRFADPRIKEGPAFPPGEDGTPNLPTEDARPGLIIVDQFPYSPIDEYTDKLKRMALRYDVPVVMTFQPNRLTQPEMRRPEPVGPTVSHLVTLASTRTKRHLALELLVSRSGVAGVLFLTTATMKEVL